MEDDAENDDRVYMVHSTDEHGDHHAVFTNDPLRAVGHYDRLAKTFGSVRGNVGFDEVVLPCIDDLRDLVKASKRPN